MTRWQILSERMWRAKAFMMSRVQPDVLEAAVSLGRAVIIEREPDGEIIGYAGIWDTPSPLWLELGAIWVADEERGSGYGTELYNRRLAIVPNTHQVCVLTGSDQAAHLALKNGFSEVTEEKWFSTVPVSVSCIPCDKEKKQGVERPDCPMRAKLRLCRMFIRDFRK